MKELIERLQGYAKAEDLHPDERATLLEAAATLEATREDAANMATDAMLLRHDAERYRWLRGSHWYVGPEPDGDTEGVSMCDRNDGTLDAAIDQARGKGGGE